MQLWERACRTSCLADGMGSACAQMEWVGARAWRGKVHMVCAGCLLVGRRRVAATAQVRLLARTCSHLLALGRASGQVLRQCRELRSQTAIWKLPVSSQLMTAC
jgi:hypothetical protein